MSFRTFPFRPPPPKSQAADSVGADPDDNLADPLFSEEGQGDGENLDLPDTASLTGISIRRKKDAIAKPSVQPNRPPAGIVRSEQAAPRNIAEYWERLRKSRRWPKRGEVDAKQIGLHWPNTVLMKVGFHGEPWRFESLISGIMRGGGQSFHNGEIEFNSMVMEWILTIGRQTERAGKPYEDVDNFPTAGGDVRYRAMAVPLGDNDSSVTHVLCHVAKV